MMCYLKSNEHIGNKGGIKMSSTDCAAIILLSYNICVPMEARVILCGGKQDETDMECTGICSNLWIPKTKVTDHVMICSINEKNT